MIAAGKLSDLIDIQQYVGSQDPDTLEVRNSNSNWKTEIQEIFAEVEALSGRDYVQLNSAGYAASHRVRMRYRDGIRVKLTRFLHRGVPLYVVHAANMENKNAVLEVLCQSGEVNL